MYEDYDAVDWTLHWASWIVTLIAFAGLVWSVVRLLA